MKTPREILIQRHQDVAPKLDAIRHKVVGSTRRSSILSWPILLWRELIWSSRRIWAGLAAVWLLLLAANVSSRDHSPASAMASASPEMILSFQQQERLLAELMGPDEPRAARPAPPFVPQSRSEGRLEVLVT